MSNYILEIKNLCVESIAGNLLVDDVSLALKPGEVLGLIGESGAGKSTIGLAAMAYARPGCRISGGQILLDGVSIRDLPAEQRRNLRGERIAYVAQSAAASFNPAHRLMDQICEVPVSRKIMTRQAAEAWATELFRALDLPDPEHFGERYPHQVSGGQLQRAMAAMAMACRPSILVMDEPTTALDVTTQIEVLILLKKLIREYKTAALYITHDLAVVAQIADRIMVLQHGKMVETGSTHQILHCPEKPYTAALVQEKGKHSEVSHAHFPKDASPVLRVENVKAFYGSMMCLNDVSLKVMRGQTVAVVGESGSGKSSLARLITGLLQRSDGEVYLNDKKLAASFKARNRDELRKVQLIYQLPDVALNPRHTVGEIIGRPLQFYFNLPASEIKLQTEKLLEQVGLPKSYMQRLSSALSGGQKQRVCIARALAARPELVICDEPTSALDPLVADEILLLLRSLQDELGLSYLFITHDLGVVRRIAHQTAVILKGKIVAEGPTDVVFAPPYHAYTEKLIHSVPEMDECWLDGILQKRDLTEPAMQAA